MRIFFALVARDIRLSLRHGADTMGAVLFFLVVVALFPLAIGPAPDNLARMAPGIIWVSALLSALLPLERLFGAEYEDGSLDQLLLCGLPASAVALAKACAHWLMTGLPLVLAAAPLALILQLPIAALPALMVGWPWAHRFYLWWEPQGGLSCSGPGGVACYCPCWCCLWRFPFLSSGLAPWMQRPQG